MCGRYRGAWRFSRDSIRSVSPHRTIRLGLLSGKSGQQSESPVSPRARIPAVACFGSRRASASVSTASGGRGSQRGGGLARPETIERHAPVDDRSRGAALSQVEQHCTGRRSAIDGRTTRHAGHEISMRIRKRIEEPFGWTKTVGGGRKLRYRGRERNRAWFKIAVAAPDRRRLQPDPHHQPRQPRRDLTDIVPCRVKHRPGAQRDKEHARPRHQP